MEMKSALRDKNREFASRLRYWKTLPVFDQHRLESSTCGDKQFITEVLQAYFTLIPESLEHIQGAIDKGNGYMLRYYAHSAKGSSQAVGAERLAAMFHMLEKELDLVDAELVLPSLRDEMRQVQVQLQGLEAA